MAYKTWAAGDVLTAADMNAMVRDQTITICTSSTRPTGAVVAKFIYETDTGQMRAYNGSGWILIALAHPPAWEMTGGGGQAIASGSAVQYVAGTAVENVGLSSFAMTPNQVTIAIPGRYNISFGQKLDTGGVSGFYRKQAVILVTRSGSDYRRITSDALVSNFASSAQSVGQNIRLNAGDIVRAYLKQDSGETLHSDDGANDMCFSGCWVAP